MSYKIKDIPISERPREKLKKYGSNHLSDSELLAIILKTGTKEKNVSDLAIEVLKNYPMHKLNDITLNKIKEIKGIGEVKAIELLAVIEIAKRINEFPINKKYKLTNAKEIYLYCRNLFINKNQEYLYALYFNSKQELLERKLLFIGTVNESNAHPREVFKEAYLLSATYIVCIHNHPSNDTTPSIADMKFTECIQKTGELHGIKVIDHIIFGYDNFYSFYEMKKTKMEELNEKERNN